MTERAPWWKAFLPRKKSGAAKDLGPAQGFGPDFNPFAQQSEKAKETPPAAASKTPCDQSQSLSRQESGKGSSLLSDDTFDDSNLESVFNEQTCRRNMKVSRSGRFKEKRRVRSTLPLEEKETENAAPGKGDVR
ncbi:proline-rich protein 15-like isoform 1-T2 [Menidia menidia]